MQNIHFSGDQGNYENESTISAGSKSSTYSKNIEEHFPAHCINMPLVHEFESIQTDKKNKQFSKKWASCYLKQLGYDSYDSILDQYSDYTDNKEDMVVFCVNQIEDQKLIPFKLSRKIVVEDPISEEMHSPLPEANKEINLICPICLTNISNFSFYKCKHSFCKECITEYITIQVNTNQVIKIRCPNINCLDPLSEKVIAEFLPENLLTKYKKFQKRIYLYQNENIRFCIRPDCENYVTIKNGEIKLTCICGMEFCGRCNNIWHENRTCEDVIDRDFSLFIKKFEIQNCPKCRSPIEKITGCNHMTCGVCKYMFCWLCKGHYTNYHFKRWNPFGCPGMQRGEYLKRNYSLTKIYSIRIKLFIFLLLSIIFIPLKIIFFQGKYLADMIFKCLISAHLISNRDGVCCKIFTLIIYNTVFIIGIAVFPLILLFRLNRKIYFYLHKKYFIWKKKKIRRNLMRTMASSLINEPLQVRVERIENLRNLIIQGDDDPL